MYDLTANAARKGKNIEVTVGGELPDPCYTAKIKDFYPGGSISYVVDPGAAQVFVEETRDPDRICATVLVPWSASVSIPDEAHTKVEIFVNDRKVLEVPVVESTVSLSSSH
jgi:hypothetical protein